MRQHDNSGGQQRLWIPILAITFLLLVGLACNLPEGLPISPPAGPGAQVYTSVAETLVVLEIEETVVETEPGSSGTPSPGTIEPSATEGGLVKIYMSENSNCRTGQSASFKRLAIIMKGEEAEVVGRDITGDYFYIRQPDQPMDFCWIWNAYATPSGPINSLPVFTSVPTATPTETP
jgi:hypothetical protein